MQFTHRLLSDGTFLETRTIGDRDTMLMPAECSSCRAVYDRADVEVVARYSDCTVWLAPCCGRRVDDRMWSGRHGFRDLR